MSQPGSMALSAVLWYPLLSILFYQSLVDSPCVKFPGGSFTVSVSTGCLRLAVNTVRHCARFNRPPRVNPLNAELNPICHLLALLGAHDFLHVSRIRVKLLTFRLLMSYIYICIYIYDISRLRVNTIVLLRMGT